MYVLYGAEAFRSKSTCRSLQLQLQLHSQSQVEAGLRGCAVKYIEGSGEGT